MFVATAVVGEKGLRSSCQSTTRGDMARRKAWSGCLVVAIFAAVAWNFYDATRRLPSGETQWPPSAWLYSNHTKSTTNSTWSMFAREKSPSLFGASDRPSSSSQDERETTSSLVADDGLVPTPRKPTHHACDGYKGIYHIAMGDIGGAAGTIFFQFVLGQIIYAQRQGLKPWVHLDQTSHVVYDTMVHGTGPGVDFKALHGRNATEIRRANGHWRDTYPGPLDESQPVFPKHFHFPGTGVWEHYFEPVSDFVPGDRSCQNKLYVTLNLKLITPGIHGFAPWAPRCWRYTYLPDYVTQPHIPLTEWLEPQRVLAHDVVRQYIRVQPYLQQAAERANPGCSLSFHACLGLHIRHSDKAAGRRQVTTAEFLPYAEAFVQAGGRHIYLATDSILVLQEIEQTWPAQVREQIRTIGHDIIRSADETAVFDLASHHRTNQEVITEILALSRCHFLIHGLSAVSEASIWINLNLHNSSVNLEDPDRLDANSFRSLVGMALQHEDPHSWPHPTRTDQWWNEAPRALSKTPTHQACVGYNGVLLISAVGNRASAGSAFFTAVLNQLLYANQYNLLPWVHLRPSAASLIYDEEFHNDVDKISRRMLHGMAVTALHSTSDLKAFYPSPPGQRTEELLVNHSLQMEGNGIWDSYFMPMSDFVPGDESCRKLPLIEMEEAEVSIEMRLHCPWCVRAWRYDGVSDSIWNSSISSERDPFELMRQKASSLIEKYYRFRPYLKHRADEVNPVHRDNEVCLGVHLRNGDKAGRYRSKIPAGEFLHYMEAYARAGGTSIYIASDSHRALQYIFNNYPNNLTRLIRTQGKRVVRTFKEWPVHMIDRHHRVNSEALVDALALSKCQLLLHGYSTVSEAAIYLNPVLRENSVNMEDPGKKTPEQFEFLVKRHLRKTPGKEPPLDTQITPLKLHSNLTRLAKQRLDGVVLSWRASTRACRSNAIVYLVQKKHSSYGRDSYHKLIRSLHLLNKNYLSIGSHLNNTDIFLFHAGDFRSVDLEGLEQALGLNTVPGVIRLVDLSQSNYWSRPPQHTKDNPAKDWYAWPQFSEGYRHMMHWFAIGIWQFFGRYGQVTGCRYEYLLRLDEDSFIHSPIQYDIFDFMRLGGYVYGFRMCAYEMQVTRRTLAKWEKLHPEFVPNRAIDLEMCGFYNNFFVAKVNFFLDPETQAFLRFVDHHGQIYRRRLGDLMIHTMAVYMFARDTEIHRFLDFTYEHGTLNETTGCLIWGGMQAGYRDTSGIATLGEYVNNHTKTGCKVNQTWMSEAELSPLYSHIEFAYRGNLTLHTVVAGRVEWPPGKGTLLG